jgi:acetyltransferase-like isoleucine patch superfamily enzyme
MSGRLAAVSRGDGTVHGSRSLAVRAARRVLRTANAAMLGWRNGRLPLGSTIINARRIDVGGDFDAAAPVWIEAIEQYAGEQFTPRIVIGDRFTVSGRMHLSAIDSIRIGDDCLFGSNVYIGDHAHGNYGAHSPSSPTVPPRSRPLRSRGPVSIGHRVWLGDNVTVLDGVTIGDGAVVGANAVVTRNIPPGSIAVGGPARVIKTFDAETGSWDVAATEPTHG